MDEIGSREAAGLVRLGPGTSVGGLVGPGGEHAPRTSAAAAAAAATASRRPIPTLRGAPHDPRLSWGDSRQHTREITSAWNISALGSRAWISQRDRPSGAACRRIAVSHRSGPSRPPGRTSRLSNGGPPHRRRATGEATTVGEIAESDRRPRRRPPAGLISRLEGGAASSGQSEIPADRRVVAQIRCTDSGSRAAGAGFSNTAAVSWRALAVGPHRLDAPDLETIRTAGARGSRAFA